MPGFQEAQAMAMAKTSEGGRLGAPEKEWLKSLSSVHSEKRERERLSLSLSLSAFPGRWIGPIGSQTTRGCLSGSNVFSTCRLLIGLNPTDSCMDFHVSTQSVEPDDVGFRFPTPTIGDVVKTCAYRFIGYSY